MPESSACHLCERAVEPDALRVHHLIPKLQLKRWKRRGRKVEATTAMLCADCHHEVHERLDNAALARRYPTIEELRAAEELQTYLVWIRKQK